MTGQDLLEADFSIVAVFFAGLLGGVHCLGMCGSIAGILTAQIPKEGARWPFHLAYNGGQLVSYMAAGLLVAGFGVCGLVKAGYTFYMYG